jgi:thymidylate synthase
MFTLKNLTNRLIKVDNEIESLNVSKEQYIAQRKGLDSEQNEIQTIQRDLQNKLRDFKNRSDNNREQLSSVINKIENRKRSRVYLDKRVLVIVFSLLKILTNVYKFLFFQDFGRR